MIDFDVSADRKIKKNEKCLSTRKGYKKWRMVLEKISLPYSTNV